MEDSDPGSSCFLRDYAGQAPHGGIHKGSAMKTIDGVVRRLPVKRADGSIDLIEIDGIFYLEAQGEDPLIRAKRFC